MSDNTAVEVPFTGELDAPSPISAQAEQAKNEVPFTGELDGEVAEPSPTKVVEKPAAPQAGVLQSMIPSVKEVLNPRQTMRNTVVDIVDMALSTFTYVLPTAAKIAALDIAASTAAVTHGLANPAAEALATATENDSNPDMQFAKAPLAYVLGASHQQSPFARVLSDVLTTATDKVKETTGADKNNAAAIDQGINLGMGVLGGVPFRPKAAKLPTAPFADVAKRYDADANLAGAVVAQGKEAAISESTRAILERTAKMGLTNGRVSAAAVSQELAKRIDKPTTATDVLEAAHAELTPPTLAIADSVSHLAKQLDMSFVDGQVARNAALVSDIYTAGGEAYLGKLPGGVITEVAKTPPQATAVVKVASAANTLLEHPTAGIEGTIAALSMLTRAGHLSPEVTLRHMKALREGDIPAPQKAALELRGEVPWNKPKDNGLPIIEDKPITEERTAFDADMEAQSKWLDEIANKHNYANVDELLIKDPTLFAEAADVWRSQHELNTAKVADLPGSMPTDILARMRDKNRREDPKGTVGDSQGIDTLKADIQVNGIRNPVVVTVSIPDKLAYVTDGNTRVSAAKELGIPTIRTVFQKTEVPFTAAQRAKAKHIDDLGISLDAIPTPHKTPQAIVDAAELRVLNGEKRIPSQVMEYQKAHELPTELPQKIATLDIPRAQRIAQLYEEMPHDPHDPIVASAYNALIQETLAQYKLMEAAGVRVEFMKPHAAYKNPHEAIRDIHENNHLAVQPTEGHFGSGVVEFPDSPLLARADGVTFKGQPVTYNDIFRAVHDYFGHAADGAGFRAIGEENAWRAHSAMYSPEARRALTTETRGQNSWVNFGKHAEHNRTAGEETTIYAPQKIGLLPEWVSSEGATAGKPVTAATFHNKQMGAVDKGLVIKSGLVLGGATLGAYLEPSDKTVGLIAGAAFGFAISALPAAGRAMSTNFKKAIGVTTAGALLVGGGYEVDGLEGALVGSAIFGLKFLPKAKFHAEDDIIHAYANNMDAEARIVRGVTDAYKEAIPEAAHREAVTRLMEDPKFTGRTEGERLVVAAHRALVQGFSDTVNATPNMKMGFIEAYVSHIVEHRGLSSSKIPTIMDDVIGVKDENATTGGNKFRKEREFRTFADLEKALANNPELQIKTMDIAEIDAIYARSMTRTIERQKMLNALHDAKDAQGASLNLMSKERFQGSVSSDIPQLRGSFISQDVMPALKFAFDNKSHASPAEALFAINRATKRVNVFGSFFHAQSLIQAYALAGGNIAMIRRDAGAALKQIREGGLGTEIDNMQRAGLKIGLPDETSAGAITHLGQIADMGVDKLLGTQSHIGESIGKNLEKVQEHIFDKVTWDYLHTGLKATTALRLMEEYHTTPKLKEHYTEAEYRKSVAAHVNDTFGGADWFGIASASRTSAGRALAMWGLKTSTRDWLGVAFFAPDWGISTFRAMSKALPDSAAPAIERTLARKYAARTAVLYAGGLNMLNYAISGQFIWENNDPTRVELAPGVTMQLVKHAMEYPEWVLHPVKTFSNKMGFMPRMGMAVASGQQYPKGPSLPGSNINYIASQLGPFTAKSFQEDTDGYSGIRRAILGVLGVTVHGHTEGEKADMKAAGVERKLTAEDDFIPVYRDNTNKKMQ